jgi:1-phosphofructokinase
MSACEVVTLTLNPAIDETITVPGFAAGAVNRVERVRQDPGGKGVNVASALADAGHRVAVTGFLGRDNAVPFETLFAAKGIDDHFVRIAGQTRVGIKIVDPIQQQTTDLNFPGQAPSTADCAELVARLAGLDTPWVVMAGSVPPGVPTEIYADLVGRVRAQGRRVLLDTSDAALRAGLGALPNVAKPNVHELEGVAGAPLPDRLSVLAAARRLVDMGIDLVVVSMGGQGACFVTREELVVARPPKVDVHSTVGAGDALVAGLVAAQLRGLGLTEAARLATAFSVDAVTRLGSGLSSPAAIDAFSRQVQVEVASPAPC